MRGLIGKKLGMTSLFNEDGKNIPCTVIQAEPNVVTQLKTEEIDGYKAIQVAFDEAKEKNTSKALKGHFDKANTTPKKKVAELRYTDMEVNVGDEVTVEIFDEGDIVDVISNSKGKGFQGVVKRHGFHGVGGSTHGQHNRQRSPGSIGAASYPARVFKGMRMGGRMGNERVKSLGLQIMKIMPEKNLIFIKGSVAGHKGTYVIIEA